MPLIKGSSKAKECLIPPKLGLGLKRQRIKHVFHIKFRSAYL